MIDFYRFKCFSKYPEVMHAVTNKSSDYPYDFSLALHTGQNSKKIIDNRALLSAALSVYDAVHFVVANQTHSDHIKVIETRDTLGWKSLENAVEDCDALLSNQKGLVLCILTADCVPILLYDKKKQVVGAVHAGWKGTQARIVSKTIEQMKEVYDSCVEDIVVGIGPAIGSCCYEVGEDVAEHFFDVPEGLSKKGEKYMLDLPWINKQQLLKLGLKEEHIEMSSLCTACQVDRYFSYRKEKGCDGRFMSVIGLK